MRTHYGKVDILVNNAGDNGITVQVSEAIKDLNIRDSDNISGVKLEKDGTANWWKEAVKETYERAQQCIETNYYGTKRVTEALLPLLRLSNSARIVNVSSLYGQLKFISSEMIKQELSNVHCLTNEKLNKLVRKFLKDFKEGMLRTNGWPVIASAYKVSKAAVNAYTRILSRKFPNIRVNVVHLGLVKTDLSLNRGNLTLMKVLKHLLWWHCCLLMALLILTLTRWRFQPFELIMLEMKIDNKSVQYLFFLFSLLNL